MSLLLGLGVTILPTDVIFARRGRAIQALFEGDPAAWSILGVVVVGSIAWSIYKSRNGD